MKARKIVDNLIVCTIALIVSLVLFSALFKLAEWVTEFLKMSIL